MKASRPVASVLVIALIAVPRIVHAQAASVAGTVVAEGSQRPLAGVQIGVVGVAGKGTTTDGSGRFSITDLTGTNVVLNFRFLGYRPATDTVRVGQGDLRISLTERALELNSLVV